MSQLFDLEGCNAIVTGASRGLGRHFALTLARAGARVALAARDIGKLTEVADEIAGFGGRALPVVLDVTKAASVEEAVDCAETELGPVHILVNNSGVAVTKPALEVTEEEWDRVLDTDLKGAWLMARAVAERIRVSVESREVMGVPLRASLGVSVAGPDGDEVRNLLQGGRPYPHEAVARVLDLVRASGNVDRVLDEAGQRLEVARKAVAGLPQSPVTDVLRDMGTFLLDRVESARV